MKLSRVDHQQVSLLREERRRGAPLGIVPDFHSRLAAEAEAYLVEDEPSSGGPTAVGYVLALERPHDGHTHVTAIESYLSAEQQHRWEEVLDLLRDEVRPTAYLTRTDDCLYNATLLARGLQVEPTALVMVWRRQPAPDERGVSDGVEIERLSASHMEALKGLLDAEKDARLLADLEPLPGAGRAWAVVGDGRPVAVIARRDGGDGRHELLDFALARAPEPLLATALRRAAETVSREGLTPAGVIDSVEAARHRVFRAAGFHTSAAYLVYYDPEAGRPSVHAVTTEELRRLVEEEAPVRIVDVLGEDHWKKGHIPGSEWIDFKGLAKQARKRFEKDEPIVVYCSGYT